jgi:hypothetical protein
MFLNDQLGDCVIAGAFHLIDQWTTYATGQMAPLTDAQALAAYEAVGGYNPSDPSTDQGCDMVTALNYWRKTGFAGHKIAGYAQINTDNPTEIAQAIYLFGNVYLGLAMPLTAQNADSWFVSPGSLNGNGSPGSWGGHCAPIVGFSRATNNAGLTVVTWGQTMSMTWNFLNLYSDEMYAVISTDWINQAGKSASGFAYSALLADLAEIT